MKDRCNNPKSPDYSYYGGRGVSVCPSWVDCFEQFYEDVGEPPSPTHTLDRIDNAQGYVPGNVRWATRKEQANNRRFCALYEYDGKRMNLAQWAEYLEVPYWTLRSRLRYGFSAERIFQKTDMRRK